MPIQDGCWNCKHGGNLKILRTLIRCKAWYNIPNFTNKTQKEIEEKINPDDNRCAFDNRFQAETGFICDNWEYDGCGFRQKR